MQEIMYERKRFISSTAVDSDTKLNVWHTVRYLQDGMTECFKKLKCDGIEVKKLGAMWVFTKTRIKFYKIPNWTDEIFVKTFPVLNSGIRTNINTEYRDENGEILIVANQEMCALSIENHRPIKLSELPYPQENFLPSIFTEKFENFNIADEDFVHIFDQKIYSQMLDMNFHMNNTEYVRLAMNCFDNEFLLSNEPDTVEVHYIAESQEKQILSVYKAEVDKKHFIRIKEGNRKIFEMSISFK